MARLYSQDPGSAREGGDLGFFDRQGMVKEFSSWAFRLKPNEMSPVFETEYGFHFLQVTERRGEQVKARHILIKNDYTQASLDRAKIKIDSIADKVAAKKLLFSTAASLYSDDKETKYNGGMMLNAENVQSRSTFIPTDKLDPKVFLTIDTMKVNSFSKPQEFATADGKPAYRFLFLKSKTDAHRANLAQDLPKIKDAAYDDKINKTVNKWFEARRKSTFVKIDPDFQSCTILKDWVSASTTSATAVKP